MPHHMEIWGNAELSDRLMLSQVGSGFQGLRSTWRYQNTNSWPKPTVELVNPQSRPEKFVSKKLWSKAAGPSQPFSSMIVHVLIYDDMMGLTEAHWQGECAGGRGGSTVTKESLDRAGVGVMSACWPWAEEFKIVAHGFLNG